MFYQLIVEKDVPIEVRDGTTLRADVFRPADPGLFPPIVTLGPYPKDIHFKDWNPAAWKAVAEKGPYMHWETVNPEWWVPQGYIVIRVDTRGTGKSPGVPRLLSMREAEDFYDVIEWAGTREWSSGKVAVMGVSYFAMNAWRVASLNPPHLAAVVPWEGAVDLYRDVNRHGGIRANAFADSWGGRVRRYESSSPGGAGNEGQAPPRQGAATMELLDERVARNNPDLGAIQAPLLSVGNWGGVGLHLRGNIEGYLGAGSRFKRLRVHSGDHFTPFYALEGRLEQLRFLEHWLKGIDTGLTREPPVKLAIRRGGEEYVWRYENEWPIARTQWTPYYLDAANGTLSLGPPGQPGTASFDAEPESATTSAAFSTAPFTSETEVTGPMKVKLWVSSTSDDADIFCTIRNLDPSGAEVTYPAASGPQIAAAYGFLRVSHRKPDAERSTPYRPFHTHDELQKVPPGEIVPIEVEVWPESIVFPEGHRLVLEVGSKDDIRFSAYGHTDPADRIQKGRTSVHTGPGHDSHLLLPVIPAAG